MNDVGGKRARDPKFEALLDYLKRNRGFDFTGYKRSSLKRRTTRRMQVVGVEGYEDYLDYLEVHPEEFAFLFNTILINVTSFFRDPEAWEALAEEVLPRIVAGKDPDEPIRVWSAGCSSGEEAYTLAMLLAEALGVRECQRRVKIYATDVDEEALAKARQAGYTPKEVEPVPDGLREKYFELDGGRYTFCGDLRRVVIFGRHDLMQDAPISRLDLLVCRNTLIYFNSEAQSRILARFHFALHDEGYLFLGRAEMLLTRAHLFTPFGELPSRIFSKVPMARPRDRMVLLAQAGDVTAGEQLGIYVRLREAAFDVAPYAHVVVDRADRLALANAEARARFGLDGRDLGRAFQDLEISYRPLELRSIIEEAYKGGEPVRQREVERARPEGETQYLDVCVTPLRTNGADWAGVSVVFEDVSPYHQVKVELERSRHELETAYEELQSTNEELETTNEELQSSNEELQTTNEELQSTNEEMETMNEELQSTNEELVAMNDELRERTAALDRSTAFLSSILASLELGVVVVDRDLEVMLWNRRAEDLWGLRSEEVEGRSLLNLDIGLPVGALKEPLNRFLGGEAEGDTLSLEAINRRGRSIRCDVTYRFLTLDGGEPLGIVLLMEETAVEDRAGDE
jgi:two-component system CheB/CheR fusion protein